MARESRYDLTGLTGVHRATVEALSHSKNWPVLRLKLAMTANKAIRSKPWSVSLIAARYVGIDDEYVVDIESGVIMELWKPGSNQIAVSRPGTIPRAFLAAGFKVRPAINLTRSITAEVLIPVRAEVVEYKVKVEPDLIIGGITGLDELDDKARPMLVRAFEASFPAAEDRARLKQAMRTGPAHA